MKMLNLFLYLMFVLTPNAKTQSLESTKSSEIEYSFLKGSQIVVNGTTNVKNFNCVSSKLFTGLQAKFIRDNTNTLYFSNTALQLAVSLLDCGSKVINNDLARILNAQQYPNILISLKDVQFPNNILPVQLNKSNITANVYITLSGKTRLNTLRLTGTQTGDIYSFKGECNIKLSDYGINPPKALFGMIKVHDEIHVLFDLKLKISNLA